MNTYRIIPWSKWVGTLAVVLAILAWTPVLPTQAAAPLIGEQLPTVSSTDAIDSVSPGAVEDTLRACLTRIPKNASIGQRMVAESSCERDEMERRPIETVPGAEYASQ